MEPEGNDPRGLDDSDSENRDEAHSAEPRQREVRPPAGSMVSVWETGLGHLPRRAATAIRISTRPMGAPLLLWGVMQIDIRIPAGTPCGFLGIYPDAEYSSGNLNTATTSFIGASVVVK